MKTILSKNNKKEQTLPSRPAGNLTAFFSPRAIVIFILLLIISGPLPGRKRERLSYDLKLGFIKGGEAVMIIRDTVYNGQDAVYYHLKGRTTGVTDRIFNVNNEYESIIDAQSYLPYKAIRNAKEKKYRYYNEAFFYQDKDSLFSEKSGWIKVPHHTTDFLTVFFYFLKFNKPEDLSQDRTMVIPTLHGHDVKLIKIRYGGTEMVETKMGMTECHVISPVVEKGKVLRRADGIKLYVSKEEYSPLQLDFETRAGTLRAILQSYKINGKEQIKD